MKNLTLKNKYIKDTLKHPLISGSTILFVGGFIGNLINYLFNLVMGRLLSVPDYGLLSSLASLFLLTAFFSTAFGNVITRFTAQSHGAENKEGEVVIFRTGAKYVVIFSLSLLVLLLLSTPVISHLLHVNNSILVIFIIIAAFFSLLLSLPLGFIQGKLWFTFLAIIAIIQPIIKLAVGVGLIYLSYTVLGPYIGILLSSAIPTIALYFYFFRKFKSRTNSDTEESRLFKKDFIRLSTIFFLSGVGFTIIQNTDILLVRHFFGPYDSGLYAALSIMGRAIFYFLSPINAVFFPLIAYKKEKKQRLFPIVLLSACLITLLSGGISLFYFTFPNFVVGVFFPSAQYQEIAKYLGLYSLYMLVLSLIYLFNNFYLSVGKNNVYKVTLVAAVAQVLLIIFFHQTLYHVIGVLLFVSIVLLIAFIVYYLRHGKD